MPNLVYEEFRTNQAEALLWLTTGASQVAQNDLRWIAYREAFEAANPRRLTDEQVTEFTILMRGLNLLAEDEPATFMQAARVPNGVFTVQNEYSGETETFNIHTVTSGPLTGQRALKRKIDGRFKGFASMTRASGWAMWARFADQEGADWTRFAHAFGAAISELGRGDWTGGREFRIMYGGNWYLVQQTQNRCISCNVPTNTPASCNNCPNFTVQVPTPPRARRTVSAFSDRMTPPPRPVRDYDSEPVTLLMCEITGAEVR